MYGYLGGEVADIPQISGVGCDDRRRIRRQFQTVEETGRRTVRPPIRPLLAVRYDLVALLSVFGRSHLFFTFK